MPTIKQKIAVAKLVGNGGNVTQAMRDAGYTEATANTPQKLTESEGFKEEARSFVQQMEDERQRLISSMKTKNLDEVGYADHTRALDTLTKNVQLLTGGATERTDVRLSPEREAEIRRALGDI